MLRSGTQIVLNSSVICCQHVTLFYLIKEVMEGGQLVVAGAHGKISIIYTYTIGISRIKGVLREVPFFGGLALVLFCSVGHGIM